MDLLYPRCAGIDVHKKTAVVCCRIVEPCGSVTTQTRIFSTMTADLLALSDWLTSLGITHVALESTGELVRRITARAIPPAGRLGSEGNPGVNALPRGESQREQEHGVEAERPRRRVWSGSARPVC